MTKALLIGINEYATQTGLAGCINDVVDIEQLLRSRNALDEVVVLTDKDATKPAIMEALAGLVDSLETGDRGYVHFSGHGVRIRSTDVAEPDGMDEVLCPHDFAWTPETSITDNELLAVLDKLELGARMILSIDSCHSGDFLRALGTKGRPRTLTPPSGFRTRGPTVRGFRAAARAPNITFVSACSPWQTAADTSFDGRPNGAFSYHFVKEIAANEAAVLDDVIAAIEKPLRDYSMSPVGENAAVPYLALAGRRTLESARAASPLRAGALGSPRAGLSVFERRWQTSLVGQPIEIEVRISVANGELTACFVVRAFGTTMVSPPIRLTGNLTYPIQLGLFGVQVIVAISDWSYGRGTIDFVLHLDLANDLPFVPRVRVARVPVHIDIAQVSRSVAVPAASSPADLVALLQLSQLGPTHAGDVPPTNGQSKYVPEL